MQITLTNTTELMNHLVQVFTILKADLAHMAIYRTRHILRQHELVLSLRQRLGRRGVQQSLLIRARQELVRVAILAASAQELAQRRRTVRRVFAIQELAQYFVVVYRQEHVRHYLRHQLVHGCLELNFTTFRHQVSDLSLQKTQNLYLILNAVGFESGVVVFAYVFH
jgi:hypothetical protein